MAFINFCYGSVGDRHLQGSTAQGTSSTCAGLAASCLRTGARPEGRHGQSQLHAQDALALTSTRVAELSRPQMQASNRWRPTWASTALRGSSSRYTSAPEQQPLQMST